MMSPTGSADHVMPVRSVLDCGRACLTDPPCVAYSVHNNIEPFYGDIVCSIYYQLSGLIADPHITTYITNNNTLSESPVQTVPAYNCTT